MKAIYCEKAAVSVHSFMIMAAITLLLLFIKTCLAGGCLLAVQLTDPVIRAEYNAALAAGSTGVANPDITLDPLSWQCLACHDGTFAVAAPYRISDGNPYRTKSIETILGAHPLGMNYDKFSMTKGYAPIEALPPGMVLMYGAVSCVTCHNLLGSNTLYHVVDNTNSELCFSCHRK